MDDESQQVPVAPNTIASQWNQYITPAIESLRVPQQGEPGYYDIGKQVSEKYPGTNGNIQTAEAQAAAAQPMPQMDQATQNKLFNGVNPPNFAETADNGLVTGQALQQPQEQLQWPEDPVQAAKQSKAQQDLLQPFYQKIAAQNDLAAATQTLESTRQQNLQQKEMLEQDAVKQFGEFKQKYDLKLQEKMAETDAALKQVEEDALNARKGTADLFAEKSTGQKIAAGIAMVLGVAHAGLSGQSGNIGVDVVTNALENDRKQNIAKFANSKEMLALKAKNLDDYNDAVFKQMQVADRQKLLQLQVISTKLAQAESVYRGSAAGAAAKSANADVQMQMEAMRRQLDQQRALQELMSQSGGNLDALDPMTAAAVSGAKPFEIIKNRQDRSVSLPNGKIAYVTKPEFAKDASQIISANEIISKNLEIIKQEVAKNPLLVKGGGWTKAGQRAQTAMGEIVAEMKSAQQLGALDNGVFKLVDGIVANPAKLINQADYGQIQKTLKNAANTKLQTMGVRGYAPDASADYKFKAVPSGMVDAKFGQFLKRK